MNDLPMTFSETAAIPQFDDQLLAMMRENALMDFNELGTVSIRRLKCRKSDFAIIEGDNVTPVAPDAAFGVCLAAYPYNYCTWYKREYQPGQEPERPDLQWVNYAKDVFPNALPERSRNRVEKNGAFRWDFKIARRTIWAMVSYDQQTNSFSIGFDKPVILDISAMSLYGPNPSPGIYRWNGIVTLCKSLSTQSMPVHPCFFVTQFVLDPNAPNGVFMFKPFVRNGQLGYLSADVIRKALEVRRSDLVQDLLKNLEQHSVAPQDMMDGGKAWQFRILPKDNPVSAPQMDTVPFDAPSGTGTFEASPWNSTMTMTVDNEEKTNPVSEEVQGSEDVVEEEVEEAPANPQPTQANGNSVADLLSQAQQVLSGDAPQQQTSQPKNNASSVADMISKLQR